MTSSILSLFVILVFSFLQVRGLRPNVFVPVSKATCQPGYAWMKNAEQQDPCLAVAYVIAACVGDTWTQPALPSGYSYDSPNGTTATPCYCSWSCYNLMMACTLCQDPAYTSEIVTWPSFSQNCPTNYQDQVFPRGYVLANNASIPYWATVDPVSWSSELFDIGQAESYATQNHSDYWPTSLSSTSSSSSRSNLGVIIGGTIGGAAGLLLILTGGYFLYKRKQHRGLRRASGETPILPIGTPMSNTHMRRPSDPSTIFPATLPGSPPLMSFETMQPHGVGPGMTIVPPTSYLSFSGTPAPPTETASFLTIGNTVVQHTRPIPMV